MVELVGWILRLEAQREGRNYFLMDLELTNGEVFTDIVVPGLISNLPNALLRFWLTRRLDHVLVLERWERIDAAEEGSS